MEFFNRLNVKNRGTKYKANRLISISVNPRHDDLVRMMIGSGCLNSVEAEPKANLKWHSGFYLAQNAAQSMNELQTKQFTALALSC